MEVLIIKNKFEELKKYFALYTKEFNLENKKDQKNIQLKIDHSRRVTTDMKKIIAGMKLSRDEKYLAKIIALYHDIGRFKQYKKYRTFSDYKSADHGELGAALIKEKKLIDNLDENTQAIIFKAIEQHNKADLKEKDFANQQQLFFTKLIRDADKLDIFNIFMERYKSKNQKDYLIKLSTAEKISEDIYLKVSKKESINYDHLKTINDLKIMQLGWIYDINFKESLELIKKRNYVETIYHSMPQSSMAADIYRQVNDYLN